MRSRIIGLIVVVVAVLALLPVMLAQSPEQSGPAEEEASSSAETQQENAPAASQSSGVSRRRDPFKMLVVVDPTSQADPFAACANRAGKGKLVIGQLQVQGFGRSVDGTWIAVVSNNTNIAYFLRAENVLCNGVVSAVNPDSIVFMEETTDARGQKGTREIVKRLPED